MEKILYYSPYFKASPETPDAMGRDLAGCFWTDVHVWTGRDRDGNRMRVVWLDSGHARAMVMGAYEITEA